MLKGVQCPTMCGSVDNRYPDVSSLSPSLFSNDVGVANTGGAVEALDRAIVPADSQGQRIHRPVHFPQRQHVMVSKSKIRVQIYCIIGVKQSVDLGNLKIALRGGGDMDAR